MGTNDLQLLESRLETRRQDSARHLDEGEFFNLYVSELILRRFQPGVPAVMSGLVDGSGDCGIDGFYCFVNSQLLTSGFDVSRLGHGPTVTVIVIQSKRATTFSEQALDKLELHLPRLLDLDRDESELNSSVNPALLEATRVLVDASKEIAHLGPKFSIEVHYATRADYVHDNTRARASRLEEALRGLYSNSESKVHFYGPQALLDLARRQEQIHKDLSIADGPLASESERGEGYLCLVDLEEIYRFVCEPGTDRIQPALFEANVRDHYESSAVNLAIHSTLEDSASPDFWWLNNGITIIAPYVQQMGRKLFLTDPQIVNGLQTSNEIHAYFHQGNTSRGRRVLVRVVRASDATVRDAIIRATNNQNQLPPGALRATDRLQMNVEEYFLKRGFFYDRRKNHYLGKHSIDRIVSMEFLAQSLTAILLQEPWRSRRDVGLLLEDETYPRIFSEDIPLETYLTSLLLVRRVKKILEETPSFAASRTYVEDYLYHTCMVASVLLTRKERPSARDIANIDMSRLSRTETLDDLVILVGRQFERYLGRRRIRPEMAAATDQATSEAILDEARRLLRSKVSAAWPETELPEGYPLNVVYTSERRPRRI